MAARIPRQAARIAIANMWGNNAHDSEESSEEISSHGSDSEEESAESENEDVVDIDVLHQDQLLENEEEDEQVQPQQLYTDKNGNVWQGQPNAQVGRRNIANVIYEASGPTRRAYKDTILETWQLFFSDQLLQKIVNYTNAYAVTIDPNVNFDLVSFKAFIGILYWRGAYNDQSISTEDLWSLDSTPFYSCVMSRSQFRKWLRYLRFDDKDLREQRLVTDTFAAISEIWDEWNRRLPQFFNASYNITVDEQLVSSRTRSPHRVYNPSKPGKYGELIRWSADSKHRYMFKGNPWTKRPEDPVAKDRHIQSNKATNLVLDLVLPFTDTGRNITSDRFFSSVPLAEELLTKRLTYVGTIKQNRRDIPPILHERQAVEQSEFAFSGRNNKVTLSAYQTKPTKRVYMLSTMHHDKQVHPDNKGKTEIQLEYNRTKAGVDSVDQMAKKYTTRSSTRRWPVIHFQNMLDISGINAATIYNHTKPNWIERRHKHRRRHFLLQLARELAKPFITLRLQRPIGLRTNLIEQMRRYALQPQPAVPHAQPAAPHAQPAAPHAQREQDAIGDQVTSRCAICKRRGKLARQANKTQKMCHACNVPICSSHVSAVLCEDCA